MATKPAQSPEATAFAEFVRKMDEAKRSTAIAKVQVVESAAEKARRIKRDARDTKENIREDKEFLQRQLDRKKLPKHEKEVATHRKSIETYLRRMDERMSDVVKTITGNTNKPTPAPTTNTIVQPADNSSVVDAIQSLNDGITNRPESTTIVNNISKVAESATTDTDSAVVTAIHELADRIPVHTVMDNTVSKVSESVAPVSSTSNDGVETRLDTINNTANKILNQLHKTPDSPRGMLDNIKLLSAIARDIHASRDIRRNITDTSKPVTPVAPKWYTEGIRGMLETIKRMKTPTIEKSIAVQPEQPSDLMEQERIIRENKLQESNEQHQKTQEAKEESQNKLLELILAELKKGQNVNTSSSSGSGGGSSIVETLVKLKMTWEALKVAARLIPVMVRSGAQIAMQVGRAVLGIAGMPAAIAIAVAAAVGAIGKYAIERYGENRDAAFSAQNAKAADAGAGAEEYKQKLTTVNDIIKVNTRGKDLSSIVDVEKNGVLTIKDKEQFSKLDDETKRAFFEKAELTRRNHTAKLLSNSADDLKFKSQNRGGFFTGEVVSDANINSLSKSVATLVQRVEADAKTDIKDVVQSAMDKYDNKTQDVQQSVQPKEQPISTTWAPQPEKLADLPMSTSKDRPEKMKIELIPQDDVNQYLKDTNENGRSLIDIQRQMIKIMNKPPAPVKVNYILPTPPYNTMTPNTPFLYLGRPQTGGTN